MKHGSITFLKLVVIFIAIAVVVLMIRMPQTEGRAKDLDLISIYADPFIAYLYIASIPFFVSLYQVIKLLSFVEQDKIFSKNSVQAFKNIKNCALISIAFIIGAAIFIRINVTPGDDPAGFIALCIFTSVISAVVTATSSVFANLLSKRVKK